MLKLTSFLCFVVAFLFSAADADRKYTIISSSQQIPRCLRSLLGRGELENAGPEIGALEVRKVEERNGGKCRIGVNQSLVFFTLLV